MKHLKKYNESVEKISIQDVKDILLELEDEGFTTKFLWNTDNMHEFIINKNYKAFKYIDAREVLLRLKDYFKMIGATAKYTINSNIQTYVNCEFDEKHLRGYIILPTGNKESYNLKDIYLFDIIITIRIYDK